MQEGITKQEIEAVTPSPLAIALIAALWNEHTPERMYRIAEVFLRRHRSPLDAIADELLEWARPTFPHATPASRAEHLRREAEELVKDPTNSEEKADIFFLLVQAADGPGPLAEAVKAKLAKNRARTWKAPDAQGVVEHAEEGAEMFPVGMPEDAD